MSAERMSTRHRRGSSIRPPSSRIGMAFWRAPGGARRSPYWGDRQMLRLLTEISPSSRWRACGIAGGLRRPRLGRPAGVRRPRRLCAISVRDCWPASIRWSASRSPAHRRADRRADRAYFVPAARRLFRHRLLGGGGSFRLIASARFRGRRRLGHQPAGGRGPVDRRLAQRARIPDLLAFAGARRRRARRRSCCCCARATAWRSPRSATTRWRREPTASTSSARACWCSSSRRRTAMVGALIFLQKLRISPDPAFGVNDGPPT